MSRTFRPMFQRGVKLSGERDPADYNLRTPAEHTASRPHRVSVWTGPCIVGTVAAFVRGLGFPDVLAGTERVHFVVYAPDRDRAHDAALRAARQFSATFRDRDVSVSSAR